MFEKVIFGMTMVGFHRMAVVFLGLLLHCCHDCSSSSSVNNKPAGFQIGRAGSGVFNKEPPPSLSSCNDNTSNNNNNKSEPIRQHMAFVTTDTVTAGMRLLRTLFRNYAKEILPDRQIVLSMNILLFKLKSTVEREGFLESVFSLLIEWQDSRMAWKPRDYGDITLLAFDSEKVWLPDIAMTNSADHPYDLTRDKRFVVRAGYNGQMRFVPSGTARTWCRLRLVAFPFDMETCSLEFESWSLDTNTMTFDGKSQVIIDSSFDSAQYFLCSYNAYTYYYTYDFSNETFTRVRVDLTVKRKNTFYLLHVIFPCIILSAIQLFVFILPSVGATTVDRVCFGTTNMLTLVVFETIVTEEMPKSSDAITALTKYITSLIAISALGILESVAVERLLDLRRKAPSKTLLTILKHFPVLLREHMGKSTLNTYFSPSKTKKRPNNAKLWREVVYRLDFLTFALSLSLVIAAPCGLFVPLVLEHAQCNDYLEENSKN